MPSQERCVNCRNYDGDGDKCKIPIFCEYSPRYDPKHCRFVEICRDEFHYDKCDSCTPEHSYECPIAEKIEDLLMDGERECEDEDEVPFNEPYDGPEEEDEP